MTCRITLVLEYPNPDAVPGIGPDTQLSALGSPRICALQFSDALRELNALEEEATEETKWRAFRAAYDYPGCSDPRRPRAEPARNG